MSLKHVFFAFAMLLVLSEVSGLRHKHVFKLRQAPARLLEQFSFLPGGTATMRLTHNIAPSQLVNSTVGLLAVISPTGKTPLNYPGNFCPLGPSQVQSMTKKQQGTIFKSFQFPYQGDEHFLEVTRETHGIWNFYFIVCGPMPYNRKIAIELDLDNIAISGRSTFLSAEKMLLPYLFLWSGLAFTVLLAIWAITLWRAARRDVFALHLLMLLLVLLKCLSIFCESFMYFAMSESGESHGWNVAFYFFQTARGLSIFSVVLLIGSGWRLMRNHVRPTEQYLFWIVLPLQLIVNIGMAAINELSLPPYLYSILQIVDVVCCIIILSPAIESLEGHPKRSIQLDRLKHFYSLLILYIYGTRVVSGLIPSLLPPNLAWTANLITEVATFVFFLAVGIEFSPSRDHPFFFPPEELKEV